jgi:6-hydroxytryprostatin B O-methyltransferase
LPDFVVTSIIRYAISNGIFYEPSPGVIAHTAASARLATDRDIHDYSRMASAEISSLLVAIPEMVAQKQELKDDGPSSAAPIAFPGYNNIFEYFGTKPEAAQRYFTFLAARSRFPRWSADFLVEAWDWKSLGEGPVVDVGGSAGSSSIVLAKALPNVKFVVQDNSAEALQGGEALTKSQNLQERITFSEHDFFTPQPVKAKAFLFKNILHDWPHADCVKMIRALLPALEEGAHVLVGESIMPDPPASRISAWDDHAIR